VSSLQSTKLWIIEATYLGKDALHIYVALVLVFGSASLCKWSLRSWKPLLVVAVAAVAGEAWDIADRALSDISQNYTGNWHDIWNTMFWPMAIMVLARNTSLFTR
jgi:hypothetical protein